VDGRHILVRVAPPPAVPGTDGASGPNAEDTEKLWAEAKQKIEGLLADIRSGKRKFEDVAKEVNEDGTKFREGSLGIFARGRMVPEFDKVAFSLEAGKVSEPVRTPFGWHLIRIDRLGKDLTPAERADAEKQYFQAQAQTFVQELVAQAKITNTVPLPPPGPGMGLE
jgi:parvulin-like peptidyl-prolyl isomerase